MEGNSLTQSLRLSVPESRLTVERQRNLLKM